MLSQTRQLQLVCAQAVTARGRANGGSQVSSQRVSHWASVSQLSELEQTLSQRADERSWRRAPPIRKWRGGAGRGSFSRTARGGVDAAGAGRAYGDTRGPCA
jgi:hypothetical protein